VLALLAAGLVGAGWYLRNLVTHGSPFWPIVATPWGDPVPESIKAVHTSFLDRPKATIDLLGDSYLDRFGGGLLLLFAGLLAPLMAWRRRRVLVAAAAVTAGLFVWARSPVTGIAESGALPETVFSTTRYALPVVAAACLALALAATDGRARLRVAARLALAAATIVNLAQTIRLEFPAAPSALTPLAGAAAGVAVAFALAWVTGRREAGNTHTWLAGAATIAAAAILAIPAAGFVRRHGETRSSAVSPAVAWLAADPTFTDGDAPLATTPAFIGPLAGDHLDHTLEAIPEDATCGEVTRRAATQWLVVYSGTLGGATPSPVKRCLTGPAFDNGQIAIYRPH
jgi:hypothetical protein